jgi:hypothetical protein
VKIEFSSDNGAGWTLLTDSIPSGEESFRWIVPEILSSECLIKITSLRNTEVYVQNTVPFEIREKPVIYNRIEFYTGVTPPVSNPENLIMPGMNNTFKLNLQNNTSGLITSVNSVLVSLDPTVSVISEPVIFNEIPMGDTAWSNTCFEIQLPETFPLDGQYSFSLYGSSPDVTDNFWIGDFIIPVLKKFPFMTVDDDNNPDSQGNGNETLEPGESVEFVAKIDNKSIETLYNVYGQLSTEHWFIQIWNNITGVDGIVYDTASYNNGNPIQPNSSGQTPIHDFVFDYIGDATYLTNFLLKIFGYVSGEEATNWDEGGIKMKWGIPIVLNESYPPSDITEPNDLNDQLLIYPNPVSDILTIEYDNIDKKLTNVKLYISDIYGRVIRSENVQPGKGRLHLNISGFSPGLYIVKLNQVSKKVIILNN